MITPDKVVAAAARKEHENLKFRNFLKNHADEDKLDKQFLRLHNELFSDYDCSRCRNCCKEYSAEIPPQDFEHDAAHLNLSVDDFIDRYLKLNEFGSYSTKHKPCDFLLNIGDCMLGDCKPEGCKNYPYTNQPERLQSLLTFIENIKICPVAYEICERLKQEYGFRGR